MMNAAAIRRRPVAPSQGALKDTTPTGLPVAGPGRLACMSLAVLVALLLAGCSTPADVAPTAEQTGIISQPATPAPLAVETDIAGDGFGIIRGRATPWAVAGGPGHVPAGGGTEEAGDSAAPVQTPASIAMITLLGPPAGSSFSAGDSVSFYWESTMESHSGLVYTLYLISGSERTALGTTQEENFGQGHQIRSSIGQAVGKAGNYNWQVVLEDPATGGIIGQSEVRAITIFDDNQQ